jgi:hypothetical protein
LAGTVDCRPVRLRSCSLRIASERFNAEGESAASGAFDITVFATDLQPAALLSPALIIAYCDCLTASIFASDLLADASFAAAAFSKADSMLECGAAAFTCAGSP